MSDTPKLLALMAKSRDVNALDYSKQLEVLVRDLERENAALREDKDRFDWLITKAPFCVLSTLSSDPAAARLKIDREMEFPTV